MLCYEARSWDYCFMLVHYPFLSVEAVFIYTVRSPRFIPSPQSVVRSPQSVFESDRLCEATKLPSVCVRGSTSYSIPVSNISKSTVYATNGIHWDVQSPFYSKPCCIRLCREWFSDISSSGKPFFTVPVPVERDTNTGFSRCSGTTVH